LRACQVAHTTSAVAGSSAYADGAKNHVSTAWRVVARRQQPLEPERDELHARGMPAARGEREPRVHGTDVLAEKGAVLVPVRQEETPVGAPVAHAQEPERALLRRECRPFAEILGDHPIDAERPHRLEQLAQRAGRIGGENAGCRPHHEAMRVEIGDACERIAPRPRLLARPDACHGAMGREGPIDGLAENRDARGRHEAAHQDVSMPEEPRGERVGGERRRIDLEPARRRRLERGESGARPGNGGALETREGCLAQANQAPLDRRAPLRGGNLHERVERAEQVPARLERVDARQGVALGGVVGRRRRHGPVK
jgi:hypothetical protein